MLPILPSTDIFDYPPDAEGLNPLEPGFGVRSMPRGMGVYCFYDPVTNTPYYIGSGCGKKDTTRLNCGLFLRITLYRNPTKAHDKKVHEAVKTHDLRLKVWLTVTEGDARKYEADAICKYLPQLNVVGCQRETSDEIRLRANANNRAKIKHRAETQTYDPNLKKKCSRCKEIKRCSEFRRSRGQTLAVVGVCKKCEVELRKLATAKRKEEALAKGVVFGQRKRPLGPSQLKVLEGLRLYGPSKSNVLAKHFYGTEVPTELQISNVSTILTLLKKKGLVTMTSRVWHLNEEGLTHWTSEL